MLHNCVLQSQTKTYIYVVPAMKTHVLPLLALLPLVACDASEPAQQDDGVVEPNLDGKNDEFSGVENGGTISFGDAVTGTFDEDFQFFEYTFRAREDAELDIEITRTGSSRSLDTTLFLYRNEAGAAPSRIGFDDDSGYGALSRISDYRLYSEGEYTIVIGTKGASGRGNFRLTLGCDSGECGPVAEPAACHPHFQSALEECMQEFAADSGYEDHAYNLVDDCEGWVDDSTEALCPDDDEPLCLDSSDALEACMTNARSAYARPTNALTSIDDASFEAFEQGVFESDGCNVGEDAGCVFDVGFYSVDGDMPSTPQLLAYARQVSQIGAGAYLQQSLESDVGTLRAIEARYGGEGALEAALELEGLRIEDAHVSVTETFGEVQWNWGDCEGGSIVATFPDAGRVLIIEDLFCYG